MTKTQIDRLGDRLKKGNISDDDLRLLDQYRLSFSEAYEFVTETIRKELALDLKSGRTKSNTSISDKLRRESIRLTQIQDIAGCRLTVPGIANQELVVQSLESIFEDVRIEDRRKRPSHGYRAVHVIVNYRGKAIEIQVRTSLQHLWAELSEKLSDIVNPAVKYGGGDETIQMFLKQASVLVANQESFEMNLRDMQAQSSSQGGLVNEGKQLADLQAHLISDTRKVSEYLHNAIKEITGLNGENNDLSD